MEVFITEEVFGNELDKLDVIEDIETEVGFSDRLTDLLGDCYKQWKIGECIFMIASTGLGKTYMIREDLYEYAQDTKSEIALLVNRNALREQQWEEFRTHELKMDRREVNVHLFTYQQIEQNGDGAEKVKEILRQCRYIVCDEAHYFISDAIFNPDTQKSFDFIMDLYEETTLIFISATPEYIMPLIEQRIMKLYNEKWRKCYNELEKECWYKEDGTERSRTAFTKKRDKIKKLLKEYRESKTLYIENKLNIPVEPKVRKYRFFRNITGHLNVLYFTRIDDIQKVIVDGKYPDKWLIFVQSKKQGKNLRDELKKNSGKKIVYVDADYDSLYNNDGPQDEAKNEMKNIRENSMFKCDILISTSVLDCGINIEDPKVKNIVIFSDDETSFKQLLGRRRFLSEDETLNLFIWKGKISKFKKYAVEYRYIYGELCDHKYILAKDALDKLLKNNRMKRILSFYSRGKYGSIYTYNELTVEAVRLKQMYCEKVWHELEKDNNFFLKEQLNWIGKEFSEEWLHSSHIYLDLNEIAEVTNHLDELYGSVYVIDTEGMKELWDRLYPIAQKIDRKFYRNKEWHIATINKALKLRKEWEDFSIKSFGDDTTNYEILKYGIPKLVIKDDIDPEYLEKSVKGKSMDELPSIFEGLFGMPIPDILKSSEEPFKFINEKLKKSPNLENICLRGNQKGTISIVCKSKKKSR